MCEGRQGDLRLCIVTTFLTVRISVDDDHTHRGIGILVTIARHDQIVHGISFIHL